MTNFINLDSAFETVTSVDQIIVLRTELLVLRELEEADWQAVHEYTSDPEVIRYMDWGPNTREDTENFIRRAVTHQQEQPRKSYTLAIVLKIQDKLIGGCGF